MKKKRLKQPDQWWTATLIVRKERLAPGDEQVRVAPYPNGVAARKFIDGNMARGLFTRGYVCNRFGRKVYEVKR